MNAGYELVRCMCLVSLLLVKNATSRQLRLGHAALLVRVVVIIRVVFVIADCFLDFCAALIETSSTPPSSFQTSFQSTTHATDYCITFATVMIGRVRFTFNTNCQ
jgi:hypothetical protein